jgi:hypothetical protein
MITLLCIVFGLFALLVGFLFLMASFGNVVIFGAPIWDIEILITFALGIAFFALGIFLL